MKEYILAVIASAALCGIVNVISPEGEGRGLKKTLMLIMSLLFICSVARPLLSLASALRNIDPGEIAEGIASGEEGDYSRLWRESLSELTEKEVSEYIRDTLSEKLGVKKEEIEVDCHATVAEDTAVLELVEVRLLGIINPRAAEELVEEICGCRCLVYEDWR